jgi:hypothetical protein
VTPYEPTLHAFFTSIVSCVTLPPITPYPCLLPIFSCICIGFRLPKFQLFHKLNSFFFFSLATCSLPCYSIVLTNAALPTTPHPYAAFANLVPAPHNYAAKPRRLCTPYWQTLFPRRIPTPSMRAVLGNLVPTPRNPPPFKHWFCMSHSYPIFCSLQSSAIGLYNYYLPTSTTRVLKHLFTSNFLRYYLRYKSSSVLSAPPGAPCRLNKYGGWLTTR